MAIWLVMVKTWFNNGYNDNNENCILDIIMVNGSYWLLMVKQWQSWPKCQ